MLKKRLITLCVIISIYTFIGVIFNEMRTPITNEAAMAQLDDSNISLVGWNIYNTLLRGWDYGWIAIGVIGLGLLYKPFCEMANNNGGENESN